ncbi:LHFPL5 [Cordylochernes scorpioides]|uniref:LHFPL5 n=1 Tax=Cordylochernes scorpioides TaxID=51811 RepID=A0ABY6K348_9ARAC|nr:LHFPL5 [Cordylochernes scorpioides]
MVIGVLIFPAGWDADVVREVCGAEADDYNPGQCGVRWAFILAVIGVCDCAVLASLAFVLGTRYVKLLPEHYINNSSLFKAGTSSVNTITVILVSFCVVNYIIYMPGSLNHPDFETRVGAGEVNSAFVADNQSLTSRKSGGGLPPVMVVSPSALDHERFSEYSHRTARADYGRNFQL